VSQQKLSEVWMFFDLSGRQKAQAAKVALQGLQARLADRIE